jgi:hypothetical protein
VTLRGGFDGALQTTFALVHALAVARLVNLGELAELLLATAVKVMSVNGTVIAE